MKPKSKKKKLRITEADYMLAQRRAARLEEIAAHGKPIRFRSALQKSKKVYDRKALKKAGITNDDLPLLSCSPAVNFLAFLVPGVYPVAADFDVVNLVRAGEKCRRYTVLTGRF